MNAVSESKLACVQCGYNLTGVAIGGGCPECGEPVESTLGSLGVSATGKRTPLGIAIASMVTGICGVATLLACGPLSLPLSIVAVVLGHMARRRIAAHPHLYDGAGLALTGLITGYIGLAVIVPLTALFFVAMATGNF